jgi:hypothetical protein
LKIAEIDGFDLGNEGFAQGGGGQEVLVQAGLEAVGCLGKGDAFDLVWEHFEFKLESAPGEKVGDLSSDL